MISVNDAHKIVASHTLNLGKEEVNLSESIGRVLAEDVYADRDFPPYNRVAMDGIAISYREFEKGKRLFEVEGLVAAGDPQTQARDSANCLEIMTGAILPSNLDTIIRYEDTLIKDGVAQITINGLVKGQNIHEQGSDKKSGEIVIKAGNVISPSEIGVLATVGKNRLLVRRQPKIMVISTGNELVEISETPKAHQIRKSNVESIKSNLSSLGLKADSDHILDNVEGLRSKIQKYLEEYDVLILSGGVSKGKLDFVPQVLDELGVEKHFHRVKQRPGKPFWFGTFNKRTTIFAFPGNPVSSFLCTQRYFIPWLYKSLGLKEPELYAKLGEDFEFNKDLTYFADVSLNFDKEGTLQAIPVKGGGSGDLAKMVDSDAFIELPESKDLFKAGESYRIWPFRNYGF